MHLALGYWHVVSFINKKDQVVYIWIPKYTKNGSHLMTLGNWNVAVYIEIVMIQVFVALATIFTRGRILWPEFSISPQKFSIKTQCSSKYIDNSHILDQSKQVNLKWLIQNLHMYSYCTLETNQVTKFKQDKCSSERTRTFKCARIHISSLKGYLLDHSVYGYLAKNGLWKAKSKLNWTRPSFPKFKA